MGVVVVESYGWVKEWCSAFRCSVNWKAESI